MKAAKEGYGQGSGLALVYSKCMDDPDYHLLYMYHRIAWGLLKWTNQEMTQRSFAHAANRSALVISAACKTSQLLFKDSRVSR